MRDSKMRLTPPIRPNRIPGNFRFAAGFMGNPSFPNLLMPS
jgi:hypothetical protein